MTIGSIQPRAVFLCDGVSTVFPVAIQAYLATDFEVILTAPASLGGAETVLVLNSTYTLAQSGSLSPTYWTLTTIAGGIPSAYPAGYQLQIVCDPVQNQQTQYVQGQAFPSLAVQTNFDRLTQMVQRLQDQQNRSIAAPDGDVSPITLLPAASARANTGLVFDANGNVTLGIIPTTTFTQALFNAFLATSALYAATAAEVSTGLTINQVYPPGNMLRYGIVPNSAAAAGANSTILGALLSYANTAGPTGRFYFPNTTGSDTYYFNAPAVVRGFCYIDLGGCTLNYTATTTSGQISSGLFLVVHDFGIENGAISVACNIGGTGSGCAIFVGGRDVSPLITVFDSLLPSGGSLGRGYIRNVTIQMANTNANNTGSCGIQMLGGIADCLFENIVIDCGMSVGNGILYEFGWATNQVAQAQRQTSHMKECVFRNLRILNVAAYNSGGGAGLALGGAENCIVENLYVANAPTAFEYYVGEALFYNPWAGVADQGAKHNITLRNIVGEGLTQTGISLQGASLASGGYLAATIAALGHPFDYAAQTDLMHFSLDGFSVGGTGEGLLISGPCDIRNGLINTVNSSGSLILSDECIKFSFNNVAITGNTAGLGVRGNFGDAIWSPTRLKIGTFEHCVVAGNLGNGIQLGNTEAVLLRNCRIGFNTIWNVANETIQTNGIVVLAGSSGSAASAGGVTCDNCYVTVPGGGASYTITGTPALTNNLVFPRNAIVGGITGWAVNGVSQCTATQLASAAAAVNVYDKFLGRLAYATSTQILYVAQGANATSTWIAVGGSGTVTPS